MAHTAPDVRVSRSTVRVLGKCRDCGTHGSALVERTTTTTTTWGVCGMRTHRHAVEAFPDGQRFYGAIPCRCGALIGTSPVKGRRTKHVCDERCTTATGHKCECSCGGANHGSAHGG